ncbi:MAG: hypothetical protein ACO3K7_01410 [Candidatus Marinamargulisbacteria bacterium]
MSIQTPGNTPDPMISAAFQSKVEKTAQRVSDTSRGMQEVMNTVKELSQELKNQQSVKTSSKEENSQLQTKTDRALEQLKEQSHTQQKQVHSQAQAQSAQSSGKNNADVVAQAMAGLAQEEELGDDDVIQKALEEKMNELMQKAEALQDVELDDPDSQYQLEQMMQNIDKYNRLKGRDSQLNKQIDDLEIQLKEQAAREELNQLPLDNTRKTIRKQLKISYNKSAPGGAKSIDSNGPLNHHDDIESTDGET